MSTSARLRSFTAHLSRRLMSSTSNSSCIFCKIIKGEIPNFKLYESEKSYAFLDAFPLAPGHSLVVPKYHGEKLHDIPDDYLTDALVIAKKLAIASGAEDYNILQNNGEIAHQVVKHVHFHMIPKLAASDQAGLVIGWPQQKVTQEDMAKVHEDMKKKIEGL